MSSAAIYPLSRAVLYGRNCTHLQEIDLISESGASIGLSRGGAAKTYDYVDPNEDCAFFALGDGGILLAVADGHRGFDGSDTAILNLEEYHAARWTQASPIPAESWPALALNCFVNVNSAIFCQPARATKGLFRTTLALALIRPAEGLLHFASVGDSHVYRVAASGTADLVWEKSASGAIYYLGGAKETHASMAAHCIIGSEPLADSLGVVAATDGISERGIGLRQVEATLSSIVSKVRNESRNENQSFAKLSGPEGDPALRATREILEATLEAQRKNKAGDNIALALGLIPGA
jgi:hypothetical protein